jgi:septum formation protein
MEDQRFAAGRRPLVLASASARRAALLREAGIALVVAPTACDEARREGEPAVAYARRIALAKLHASRAAHPDAIVLAADTVVWRPPDGPPIGKPRDRDHARALLRSLCGGHAHAVTTAWAIAEPSGTTDVHDETTRVWMRAIDDDELEWLVEGDEWADKAGGYAIQGRAGAVVTRLDGSYTNVVGLPVAQVIARLRAISGAGR